MARPGSSYPYTGTFVSELAATGREHVTIVCAPCGHSRTLALADVLAEHGDVVLPHALSLVTARCKRRGTAANISCSAVFGDPVTVEEAEAIRAARA